MKGWGQFMIVIGAVLIIIGFFADPSVGGFVNLHALFVKGALIIVGAACIPGGAVLLAVAARQPPSTNPPTKPDTRPEALTLWAPPGQRRP